MNRGPLAAVVVTDNQPNAEVDLVEETQPLVEHHLYRLRIIESLNEDKCSAQTL